MGNCYEKIMFMVMDNTKINVTSATYVHSFDFKTLNDFCNKRGGFSVDTANGDHYIWQSSDKKEFVEFDIVREVK